jgi:hypothetical protein
MRALLRVPKASPADNAERPRHRKFAAGLIDVDQDGRATGKRDDQLAANGVYRLGKYLDGTPNPAPAAP